jgi:hypothetical protein
MEKFNILKKWLNIDTNNDFIDLSSNHKNDTERRVIAKKDIMSGTIIMCINDDKLIDNDYIKTLPNYDKYKDKIVSYNSLIALYMVFNENNPKWKPYYDIMPKDLNNFWYYVDPKIKKLIKNTHINKLIDEFKYDRFDRDINILREYFKEFNDPKFVDKWIKYKLLVNSRVFGYTKNITSCSGMVPLADMLNHDIKNNCDWSYDNSKKGFIMKSNRTIKKGEELLDSYGDKQTYRYYLLYGFVPDYKKKINDMETTINDLTCTINTDINYLLNSVKNKEDLLKCLINKLMKIPTKKILIKEKVSIDIVYFITLEKEIIKKLIKHCALI